MNYVPFELKRAVVILRYYDNKYGWFVFTVLFAWACKKMRFSGACLWRLLKVPASGPICLKAR